MVLWVTSLTAVISTGMCISLWFRDVRRVMGDRMQTVESAACQLTVYREKAFRSREDPEAAAVLARSEKIYRQAVDLYNQTMQKLWISLPARLMGFRDIS